MTLDLRPPRSARRAIATAVVLAHVVPLLLGNREPKKKPPPPPPPLQARVIDEGETDFADQTPTVDGKPCAEQYVGIGVIAPFSVIQEVAPNGPAARAGLRAGDTIVETNENFGRNVAQIGATVRLTVERVDGRRLSVIMRASRICEKERDQP